MQVGDVTFGQGDEVDAGKRQSFEQACGVFLVATEASSDSARTTSNFRLKALRISAWNPARSSVAPEMAWSEYSSTIVQP
jgi:hypothetical protein